MFKKLGSVLGRAGKKDGVKYQIEVQVQHVEGLPASVKKCRVVWSRSAKVAITSDKDARSGKATFNEALTQIVTMYRDADDHWMAKEYAFKVQVLGRSSDDPATTIGKAELDMARFVRAAAFQTMHVLSMPMKVSGASTAFIKLVIKSTPLVDDDAKTDISGISGMTSEDVDSRHPEDLHGFETPESSRKGGKKADAAALAKRFGGGAKKPLSTTPEEDDGHDEAGPSRSHQADEAGNDSDSPAAGRKAGKSSGKGKADAGPSRGKAAFARPRQPVFADDDDEDVSPMLSEEDDFDKALAEAAAAEPATTSRARRATATSEITPSDEPYDSSPPPQQPHTRKNGRSKSRDTTRSDGGTAATSHRHADTAVDGGAAEGFGDDAAWGEEGTVPAVAFAIGADDEAAAREVVKKKKKKKSSRRSSSKTPRNTEEEAEVEAEYARANGGGTTGQDGFDPADVAFYTNAAADFGGDAAVQQEVERLRLQLAAAQEAIAAAAVQHRLEVEAARNEGAAGGRSGELEDVDTRLAQLKEQEAEVVLQAAKLAEQSAAVERQLEDGLILAVKHQQERKRMEAEILTLTQQLEEAGGRAEADEDLLMEVEDLRARIAELEGQAAALTGRVDELTNDNVRLQLAAKTPEDEAALAELEALKQSNEELGRRVEALALELRDATAMAKQGGQSQRSFPVEDEESLLAELETLREENEQLVARNESLALDLAKLPRGPIRTTEDEELLAEVDALREENEELVQQNEALTQRVEEALAAKRATGRDGGGALGSAASAEDELLVAELEELRGQLSAMRRQNEQLQTASDQAAQTAAVLTRDVAELLELEHPKASSSVTDVDALAPLASACDALCRGYRDRTAEVADLQVQLAAVASELEAVQIRKPMELHGRVQALTTEKAQLQAQLDEATSDAAAMAERVDELQLELDAATAENVQLAGQVETLRAEMEAAEKLAGQVTTLRAELAKAEERLAAGAAEVEQLQADLEAAEADVEAACTATVEAQAAATAATAALSAAERSAADAAEQARADMDAALAAVAEAKAAAAAAAAALAAAEAVGNGARVDHGVAAEELHAAVAESNVLRDRIVALEAERDVLANECADLQVMVHESQMLRGQVVELHEELRRAEEHLAASSRQVAALEDERDELQDELRHSSGRGSAGVALMTAGVAGAAAGGVAAAASSGAHPSTAVSVAAPAVVLSTPAVVDVPIGLLAGPASGPDLRLLGAGVYPESSAAVTGAERDMLAGQITHVQIERDALLGQVSQLQAERDELAGQVVRLEGERAVLQTQLTEADALVHEWTTYSEQLGRDKADLEAQLQLQAAAASQLQAETAAATSSQRSLDVGDRAQMVTDGDSALIKRDVTATGGGKSIGRSRIPAAPTAPSAATFSDGLFGDDAFADPSVATARVPAAAAAERGSGPVDNPFAGDDAFGDGNPFGSCAPTWHAFAAESETLQPDSSDFASASPWQSTSAKQKGGQEARKTASAHAGASALGAELALRRMSNGSATTSAAASATGSLQRRASHRTSSDGRASSGGGHPAADVDGYELVAAAVSGPRSHSSHRTSGDGFASDNAFEGQGRRHAFEEDAFEGDEEGHPAYAAGRPMAKAVGQQQLVGDFLMDDDGLSSVAASGSSSSSRSGGGGGGNGMRIGALGVPAGSLLHSSSHGRGRVAPAVESAAAESSVFVAALTAELDQLRQQRAGLIATVAHLQWQLSATAATSAGPISDGGEAVRGNPLYSPDVSPLKVSDAGGEDVGDAATAAQYRRTQSLAAASTPTTTQDGPKQNGWLRHSASGSATSHDGSFVASDTRQTTQSRAVGAASTPTRGDGEVADGTRGRDTGAAAPEMAVTAEADWERQVMELRATVAALCAELEAAPPTSVPRLSNPQVFSRGGRSDGSTEPRQQYADGFGDWSVGGARRTSTASAAATDAAAEVEELLEDGAPGGTGGGTSDQAYRQQADLASAAAATASAAAAAAAAEVEALREHCRLLEERLAMTDDPTDGDSPDVIVVTVSERDALLAERDALSAQLAEAESTSASWHLMLDTATAERDALAGQVAELKASSYELLKQLDEAKADSAAFQEQLQEAEADNEALLEQLANAKADLDALRRQLLISEGLDRPFPPLLDVPGPEMRAGDGDGQPNSHHGGRGSFAFDTAPGIATAATLAAAPETKWFTSPPPPSAAAVAGPEWDVPQHVVTASTNGGDFDVKGSASSVATSRHEEVELLEEELRTLHEELQEAVQELEAVRVRMRSGWDAAQAARTSVAAAASAEFPVTISMKDGDIESAVRMLEDEACAHLERLTLQLNNALQQQQQQHAVSAAAFDAPAVSAAITLSAPPPDATAAHAAKAAVTFATPPSDPAVAPTVSLLYVAELEADLEAATSRLAELEPQLEALQLEVEGLQAMQERLASGSGAGAYDGGYGDYSLMARSALEQRAQVVAVQAGHAESSLAHVSAENRVMAAEAARCRAYADEAEQRAGQAQDDLRYAVSQYEQASGLSAYEVLGQAMAAKLNGQRSTTSPRSPVLSFAAAADVGATSGKEVSRLREQLEAALAERDAARRASEAAVRQLAEVQAELEQARERVEEAEEAARQQFEAGVEAGAGAAASAVSESGQDGDALQSQIVRLQNELASANSRADRLERSRAALEDELREEAEARAELEEQVQARLDEAGDDEAAATVAAFERKYERLRERYQALQESNKEEVEELTEQLTQAHDQLAVAQEQLQLLQRKLDAAQSGALRLPVGGPITRAASSGDSAQLDELRRENDNLVQQLVAKNMDLAQLAENEIIVRRDLLKAKETNMKLAQKLTALEVQATVTRSASGKQA